MKFSIVDLPLLIAALLCLASCGGSSNAASATTYTIGGTVSGLSGSGLVLQNNGAGNLTLNSGATSFTFAAPIAGGSAYAVTILTQPSNPTENCSLTGATGTANANVVTVQVSCTTAAPSNYTVGGVISGLAGSGLVLQDNGGDNLAIASSQTTFTFATAIASGGAYSVTVLDQPSNPAQTCVVTKGVGAATANVTSVQVACTTTVTSGYTIGGTVTGLTGSGLTLQDNGGDNLTISPGQTAFTFATAIVSGSSYDVTVLDQPKNPAQTCAVTKGSGTATADVTTVQVTCTTTAPSGYTIGGTVTGLTGSGLVLQDNGGDNLTISPDQTTFTFTTAIVSGGSYNVTVLDQPKNPAQNCMVSAGGSGIANANVTTVSIVCVGDWVWVDGSNSVDQPGSYGTLGTGAPGNVPGGRYGAVSWTDPSGNFWLFGGYGYASAGAVAYLNDLWEYSAGQWIWISGSKLSDASGVYGTLGVASNSATPGARSRAVSWIDASGNLWLFSGEGFDSAGTFGVLNDLWKFGAGQWTWVGGSNIANQLGVYGTQGVAAGTNVPGARSGASAWIDKSGSVWIFGGGGYDSVSDSTLNDLWRYSAGQWTWMSGAITGNQSGVYGTLGTSAPNNVPGSRYGAAEWIDASGDLWLFGGYGFDSTGSVARLNDLWKYSAGEWTWVGGSNTTFDYGIYGVQGVAAAGNFPGSRDNAVSWTDASGNFWLFGGFGQASGGELQTGELNDLWRYADGQWTWMSGSNEVGQTSTYGTLGVPDPANVPGGRDSAIGWIDASGNLWLLGGADNVTNDADNDLWEYQR